MRGWSQAFDFHLLADRAGARPSIFDFPGAFPDAGLVSSLRFSPSALSHSQGSSSTSSTGPEFVPGLRFLTSLMTSSMRDWSQAFRFSPLLSPQVVAQFSIPRRFRIAFLHSLRIPRRQAISEGSSVALWHDHYESSFPALSITLPLAAMNDDPSSGLIGTARPFSAFSVRPPSGSDGPSPRSSS